METFSVLLALCAGNSPVTSEFPAQRPVTGSFDVFFDLCLNKRLRKQSWGWWFETPLRSLWRHCNDSPPHFRPTWGVFLKDLITDLDGPTHRPHLIRGKSTISKLVVKSSDEMEVWQHPDWGTISFNISCGNPFIELYHNGIVFMRIWFKKCGMIMKLTLHVIDSSDSAVPI